MSTPILERSDVNNPQQLLGVMRKTSPIPVPENPTSNRMGGHMLNIMTPKEKMAEQPISTPSRSQVMRASDVGLGLIKESEGYRNKGYFATEHEAKKGVVTAGYGSTGRVKHGEAVTEEQAEKFLREDVSTAEDAVRRLVKTNLSQNEFDALVSLVYNVGEGNFAKSNALKALNEGDRDRFLFEAFDANKGFTKQSGKVLKGLVERRKKEQELFQG